MRTARGEDVVLRWTKAEDDVLIDAARRGVGPKAISAQLPGRTPNAASTRTALLRKMGRIPGYAGGRGRPGRKPAVKPQPLSASARGKRTCLSCGQPFDSVSAMNRLCPRCKASASRDATPFDVPATIRYR